MKTGRLLGIFILCCNCALAADNTTEHPNKFGTALKDIFRSVVTNLTSTNATAAPTNSPPPSPIGQSAINSTNAPVNPAAAAALSSIPMDELTAGLRQALSNGLTHAVTTLGHTNGFLTNVNVRILLPPQLTKVETALRDFGQGAVVDEFVASMNHAAEAAAPSATGVLIGAISQMTIGDARSLLASDSKTAITDYFRKTTTNQLAADFLPIVREATAKAGVTSAYKKLEQKIPFGSALFTNTALDLDQYVTDKALDGLFVMIGEEEKRIRENPQARVTTLLEKIFGTIQKSRSQGRG